MVANSAHRSALLKVERDARGSEEARCLNDLEYAAPGCTFTKSARTKVIAFAVGQNPLDVVSEGRHESVERMRVLRHCIYRERGRPFEY